MKCEVDPDRTSSCKRCRLSQIPCIFKPRANVCLGQNQTIPYFFCRIGADFIIQAAAIPQELVVPSILRPHQEEGLDASEPKLDPKSVLARLAAIEALLGIASSTQSVLDDDVSLQTPDTESESPFSGVWLAAAHLKLSTRPPQSSKIWSRAVIKQLWLS